MWNSRHESQTRRANRARAVYSASTLPPKAAANVALVETSLELSYFVPREQTFVPSHGEKNSND